MNKLEPYQYATAFYLNMGATQYNLMHREIIWQPLQLNLVHFDKIGSQWSTAPLVIYFKQN